MALLLVALLSPAAGAQDAVATQSSDVVLIGGEPGRIQMLIADADVKSADRVGAAIPVDPKAPVNVSLLMTPPENETWDVLGMRVGLVVSGPGSSPPPELSRLVEARNRIPPGFTVILNRTIDLSGLKSLGTGVFLMQVSLEDSAGGTLFAQSFYVRVVGNPLLTASGAVVTALSVATGYGLWRLVSDVRELLDAYKRHRREKRLRVEMRATGVVAKARGVMRDKDKLERRGVLRWTLTGTGLGAVLLSWAHFLGYVAFDGMALLMTCLETGGAFLGGGLVVVALHRRFRPPVPVRVIIPSGPEPVPEAQPERVVAEPPRAP